LVKNSGRSKPASSVARKFEQKRWELALDRIA
jgi:hypothetical protein